MVSSAAMALAHGGGLAEREKKRERLEAKIPWVAVVMLGATARIHGCLWRLGEARKRSSRRLLACGGTEKKGHRRKKAVAGSRRGVENFGLFLKKGRRTVVVVGCVYMCDVMCLLLP